MKEDVQKTIVSAGRFTTDDEAYLSFKTGGIIEKIFVKEGDAVKKGELLATLNLGEINAMVAQAKAGYEKAKRDYNRVSNLYRDSVATLEQLQNAKTGMEVAEKQLSIAEFNSNYSEIRALSDGYVLKKFANEGQMVASGSPVIQTNGAGKGEWYLKAALSDIEWVSISLNDKADIELDAYPGIKYASYVFRKSEGVDPYTGTFTVDLKITSALSSKIASGLFGKAEIFPHSKIKSWKIPYESLLDGDGDKGYVFATNDGNTAKKVEVTIAGLEKDFVLVSSGLENYKSLIVSGSAYLNDNSSIRIVE